MKKVFLFILVIVMSMTLVACGGSNNDENNAAVKVKIDEAITLVQEINEWYNENDDLQGDSAKEFKTSVDTLSSQMDELQTAHQAVLDAGGYSEEEANDMIQSLDASIVAFKKVKKELKTINEAVEDGKGLSLLIEKYNELVDIVNEASLTGEKNGWGKDEAFNSELNGALELLEVVRGDLENPDVMDEEYMKTISTSFDELIPVWNDYLTQVSEPYSEK